MVPSVAPAIAVQRQLALSSSRATLKCTDIEILMRGALFGRLRQFEEHGDEPIIGLVEARVRKAEKALKSRIKHANRHKRPDYDALHEVRIAGKKLRYLLEFFAPVLKGRHENVIKRLTTFQTKPGNLNDLVVSEVNCVNAALWSSREPFEANAELDGRTEKRHLRSVQSI